MLNNRRFRRGSDISSMIAGLLPLDVWRHMDAQARGDANGNICAEQLTYIIEKVYERAMPNHPLLDMINFDTSPPEGAQATRYYEGESRARFSPMGPQGEDFNTADLKKKAVTVPVEWYFSGYELWMREAAALAMSDSDAIPRLAYAVTMAYRDLLVLHCLTGDPDAGIDGFLTTDKISNTRYYSDANRLDVNSTAAAQYDLLVGLCDSIADTSEDVYGDEGGYLCALPSKLDRLARRTYFASLNISVADRVEQATGFRIIGINRLNSISGDLLQDPTGDRACAIVGKFTAETHAKMMPKPLEQMTPHIDHAGLRSVVPAVTAIGGLHLYEPLSFATARNIYDPAS